MFVLKLVHQFPLKRSLKRDQNDLKRTTLNDAIIWMTDHYNVSSEPDGARFPVHRLVLIFTDILC